MNEWINELRELSRSGRRAVIVTVSGVRGSAPRNIGTKMLVSECETLGTIGGGELEYQCTRIACELLRNGERISTMARRFPLGSNCGQCCGGVVDVLFEESVVDDGWFDDLARCFDAGTAAVIVSRIESSGACVKQVVAADKLHEFEYDGDDSNAVVTSLREALSDNDARLLKLSNNRRLLIEPVTSGNFDVAVFGAGHVGAAMVAVLSTLDCNVRWIDGRRDFLNQKMPANVQAIRSDAPEREVAAMPAGAFYLVMTHSHSLDYDICSNVLNRNDFAYCGLIGSLSKQRRFSKRLGQDGVSNIDRLVCPIGVSGIGGKKPAEIAISTSAEMLQVREARAAGAISRPRKNMHLVKGQ